MENALPAPWETGSSFPEPRTSGRRILPPSPPPPAPPGYDWQHSPGDSGPSSGGAALIQALSPGLNELAVIGTSIETCEALSHDPCISEELLPTVDLARSMLITRLEQLDLALELGQIRMQQAHWDQFRSVLLENSGPCPRRRTSNSAASRRLDRQETWLYLSPGELWDLRRLSGPELLRRAVALLQTRLQDDLACTEADSFTRQIHAGFLAIYFAGLVITAGDQAALASLRLPSGSNSPLRGTPFAPRTRTKLVGADLEALLHRMQATSASAEGDSPLERSFLSVLIASRDDLSVVRFLFELDEASAEPEVELGPDPDLEPKVAAELESAFDEDAVENRKAIEIYRQRFRSHWINLSPIAESSTSPSLDRIAAEVERLSLFGTEELKPAESRSGAETLIDRLIVAASIVDSFETAAAFEARFWSPFVTLLRITGEQMSSEEDPESLGQNSGSPPE